MNNLRYALCFATLTCLVAMGAAAQEQPQQPAATPTDTAPPVELEQPRATDNGAKDDRRDFARRYRHGDVIVHFGHDSNLPATETADSLVAIVGSSTSAGEVFDSVVSVFGNTRVTGRVDGNAVAVFGDTYVNSYIGHDVVAVFGDVELGPQAQIEGDIVVVGGTLMRDAAAVVRGGLQEFAFPGAKLRFDWLQPWLKHCLLYGRPLALEPGLGWAWSLAFGFLALYVFLGLVFPDSVERCAETVETRPGRSLLAALLVILAIPGLLGLLAITVIGLPLIPFVGIALFCLGLFGKAVMLAAIGRRLTSFITSGPLSDVAFTVLAGGFVVLGLYMVPVLGFIVYKLLGFLGMGVIAYTLILASRAKSSALAPAAVSAGGAGIALEAAGLPDAVAASDAVPAASEPAPGPAVAIHPNVTLPRAGFAIRMLALFIDAVVISVALKFLHDQGEALLLVLAIYGAVMWKLKGTTLGGLVCNLQVVRLDGAPIDWNTAVMRALGCLLSAGALGIGFFWIAHGTARQAWHDKIAGTVVIRVPQGVSTL